MILPAVLRTLAQLLLGYVLAWLASRGLGVPVELQNWFVETLMVGGGVAVFTATVRWLETNKNPTLRLLGRVLMLGIVWQPTGYDTHANIHTSGGGPATRRPDPGY